MSDLNKHAPVVVEYETVQLMNINCLSFNVLLSLFSLFAREDNMIGQDSSNDLIMQIFNDILHGFIFSKFTLLINLTDI